MDATPKKVLRAVNITKTRIGLHFNYTEGATLETSTYRPHEIVALDPGVRTFMTGYYADGVVIEWGAGEMNRIYAMLRFADKLRSNMDKWKNKIATYKDELTKEHPEVKRRTVELTRLNAAKAQLTNVLKETNATFIQYRCESVSKKKELAEKTESLGKDHHVVKKLKREIHKLDINMKHLVASDPDIAKAHNDVTRSKGELGKYKDVLVESDHKFIKMEKQFSTYNRAYLRLLLRLRYKIDEAHSKLANYLCRNVRIVLLPKFETSRMVKNADRNISAVTARKMMNWGHYRFRKMLLNKAALYL